jgi:hypothetical protein
MPRGVIALNHVLEYRTQIRSADPLPHAPAPGTRRSAHGELFGCQPRASEWERELQAFFQSPERIPVRAPELKTRLLLLSIALN